MTTSNFLIGFKTNKVTSAVQMKNNNLRLTDLWTKHIHRPNVSWSLAFVPKFVKSVHFPKVCHCLQEQSLCLPRDIWKVLLLNVLSNQLDNSFCTCVYNAFRTLANLTFQKIDEKNKYFDVFCLVSTVTRLHWIQDRHLVDIGSCWTRTNWCVEMSPTQNVIIIDTTITSNTNHQTNVCRIIHNMSLDTKLFQTHISLNRTNLNIKQPNKYISTNGHVSVRVVVSSNANKRIARRGLSCQINFQQSW